MEANEVKRMKNLEEENSRPKRIVANLTLENDAVKNVLGKKYGMDFMSDRLVDGRRYGC